MKVGVLNNCNIQQSLNFFRIEWPLREKEIWKGKKIPIEYETQSEGKRWNGIGGSEAQTEVHGRCQRPTHPMSWHNDEDVENKRQNAENDDDNGNGATVTVASALLGESFLQCCVADGAPLFQLFQQEGVVDVLNPRCVTVALFNVVEQLRTACLAQPSEVGFHHDDHCGGALSHMLCARRRVRSRWLSKCFWSSSARIQVFSPTRAFCSVGRRRDVNLLQKRMS